VSAAKLSYYPVSRIFSEKRQNYSLCRLHINSGILASSERTRGKQRGKYTYTTRVRLDVNAPLFRVEFEGLEGPFATEDLELVDILVPTIITGIWEAFGVFIGQDGAIGLHRCTTGEILRIVISQAPNFTS
jgi:hypothetical protein